MNKKILFISIFILMIVLSIGAVSAENADDAIASNNDGDIDLGDSDVGPSGSVSGGVDVVAENPWTKTGEISYDIPSDAKTIKSADVYVNVFGVKIDDSYGVNTNTTITTNNGDVVYRESLSYNAQDKNKVYPITDNVTGNVSKSNLDYLIHYDITSQLKDLNGTTLKIKVDTAQMPGKLNTTNNGYIKFLGLVIAYDDGDNDVIDYWINDDQTWTNSNLTLTFDTTSLTDVLEMNLVNIALDSADASYKLNGEFLTDPQHKAGSYYQYNKWDVTDYFNSNRKTEFLGIAGQGGYGPSHRQSLAVLTAKEGKTEATVSIATERKSTYDIVYPGTYNQITVTVKANKNGNYTVQLFADGTPINSTEVTLTAGTSKPITLIDPTKRDITANTEYVPGAYDNVNYTAKVFFDSEWVNESSLKAAILYNGYFSKDLSYPGQDYELFYNGTVTGDIVIDVSKEPYVSGMTNRNDVWTVELPSNSTFVKAWIYLGYSGAKSKSVGLDVTFNGATPTIASFKRDQANVISTTGYGLIVYDVTDLMKSGENTFVINKTVDTGLYPSTLIYLYNTTGSSSIRNVYISSGADLVGTYGNAANRVIQVNTTLAIDSSNIDGAVAYIFGAGSTSGRASIAINGEVDSNVWADPSNSVNIYRKDIMGTVNDINNVSITLKNSMFTTLQQIIVTTKLDNVSADVSLVTERYDKNSGMYVAYPGTFNEITVTVNPNKPGKYVVELLDNGVVVNSTEVSLDNVSTPVTIIDPTIRPIDASTVSTGASGIYNKVNYTARVLLKDVLVNESSLNPNILYNGYLSKDYSYPGQDFGLYYNVTITGDIVTDVSKQPYATGLNNRVDNWNVTLPDGSNIVKAFVYVAYSASGDSEKIFNVTFNGVKPAVVSYKRDQSNTPSVYGYGLIVYDVTDLIKTGENTFVLNKTSSGGAYPSTLIYLYNTTGSKVLKDVYIYNGADVIGSTGKGASRNIQFDTTLNVNSSDAVSALAYIFGAGSKTGRASIIINGEENATAWDTNVDSTINRYVKDITATVKDANNVSILLKSSMFTALQQIVVVTKNAPAPTPTPVATVITAPKEVKITYNTNGKLTINLKDSNNNPVADAKVVIVLNGVKNEVKTDAKGQASLIVSAKLVPKTYEAIISYDGDATHIKSTAKTSIVVKKASVKLTAKKKTFKAKVKTKKYTVTLKDNKGKAMKKVKLSLKVKGKTVKATTNAKGKATFKIKNLKKKGTYKAKITFKGDKCFNKLTKKATIKIKK